jgi:hypothetical protein
LTGDIRHKTHITNGQRVSQHSLPKILFFILPIAQFFIQLLCRPANGTLIFAPTEQANPQKNANETFLSTHLSTTFQTLFILKNEIREKFKLS